MTKIVIIITSIVMVIIGIILISPRSSDNTAPNFSLKNYQGDTVQLSDFKGTPIVINSWAAWCLFCLEELKDFAKLQKEFEDQIVIIAINRAESLSTNKKYTDDSGISNELIFLLDPKDLFYQSIGGFSMPETIFVNEDRTIIFHKRGPMKFNEMQKRTKELFNV
ncbi:TlpA family protein disulfide reductase [Patescibacteria group bacterium AH-259-L05]|nr:TlpA family protein disulfide reductase [Patescibacteria group bacterium AH-259-L05]